MGGGLEDTLCHPANRRLANAEVQVSGRRDQPVQFARSNPGYLGRGISCEQWYLAVSLEDWGLLMLGNLKLVIIV